MVRLYLAYIATRVLMGSRGNGAHDFDVLGTITVNHDGNFNFGNDVNVDPNVFDGVREFA